MRATAHSWSGPTTGRRRSGQYSSISCRVDRMLVRLDAPKTIDSMFGCAQTHSIASRGGIAPEAKTDIAIGRNRRSAQRLLVRLHARRDIRKPILLMLEQTIGLSMPSRSSTSSSSGSVHGDEAGLGVVAPADVVGEDAERLVEAEAEQQVDDDVLQEDDRRRADRANIFISASISSVMMPSMSLLGQRAPAAQRRVDEALVGQEAPDRPERAVLGHRVGVLVRVRHAREERHVRVPLRIGPDVVGDQRDPVVGGAHEGARRPRRTRRRAPSMTASMSWKRIAWARAFSSDMWLTPKNWLSPNSSRSIGWPSCVALIARTSCRIRAAGAGGGKARERRSRRGRELVAAVGGVVDQHGDRTGRSPRRRRRSSARPVAPLADPRDEVVDLGAVLLAAQVEPDRRRSARSCT